MSWLVGLSIARCGGAGFKSSRCVRSSFSGSPVTRALLTAVAIVGSLLDVSAEQRPQPPAAAVSLEALTATAHPALPRDAARLWLAPVPATRPSPALAGFSKGVRLHGQAQYAEALPLVRKPLANTPLADYGQYYTGLTELRLSRLDEARTVFEALV